jgi:hypothetical protein
VKTYIFDTQDSLEISKIQRFYVNE